jgi:hypothetical protein
MFALPLLFTLNSYSIGLVLGNSGLLADQWLAWG